MEQPSASKPGTRAQTRVVLIGDGAILDVLGPGVVRLGHPTELVRLTDDDGPALDACARLQGRAMFVLARGGSLDRARVDRLRSSLAGLGVPLSRALVVDPGEGEGALARISAIAARMTVTGGSTPPPIPAVATPRPAARVSTPTGRTLALPLAEESASHPRPPRRRVQAVVTLALGVAALVLAVRVATQPAPEVEPSTARGAVVSAPAVPREPSRVHAPAAPIVAAPSAPAVEDAPEIAAALKKREVRALDLLVIAPEAKKAMGFASASAYCGALEVAGITGWRLPEIGELISMSRAKFLRKGSLWSATKGDSYGDLRLVLVIKRERISPVPAKWDGGRVVCVRERA